MFIQAVIYGNPDYYPPMIHGAGVLERYGWRQEIISHAFLSDLFPHNEMTYPSGTRVIRIKSSQRGSLASYVDFVRQVVASGKREADIVIAYDVHALLPAWILARRYHKPLVYHNHDYVDNNALKSINQRIFKQLEMRLAPTADLVIVPDYERAQVMVNQLGLRDQPMIVANCPLNSPDRQSTVLQDTLHKLGKHFEGIVFRQGHVGPGHALEVTIRSMAHWVSQEWGFVIMGPCEEDYRKSLERLAADIGVSNRFSILPAVSFPEVAKYTVGAHLGHALFEPVNINHRYSTTASNKILEYMAAGVPLLLSGTTGSRSLLEKYHNGVIADIESCESIAAAINRVLSDESLARSMGENSRRAFAEEYNYEHQYAPVLEQFGVLAANHNR